MRPCNAYLYPGCFAIYENFRDKSQSTVPVGAFGWEGELKMKLKKALAFFLAAAALLALLPGTARADKDISIVGLLFGDQMFPDAVKKLSS